MQVWPDRPGNLAFEVALGDQAPTAKAIARRAAHGVADAGQPAPGHQLSRHPRRHCRIRRGARPPDADARQPGQPLPARHACARCSSSPPEKMRVVTPDVGGGFGTKLFIYREYALAALAAQTAQAAGALDRRSHRAFPRRCAGPRQHHHGQAGARRQGALPRARHRPDRRHGRVSVGLRAVHSVPRRRHVAGRLRHSGIVTSGCAASTPTPCRSMPIAAPAGRRRPT